nr:MAG TPA: hypothetical protein [Caudoviricetes sp.]
MKLIDGDMLELAYRRINDDEGLSQKSGQTVYLTMLKALMDAPRISDNVNDLMIRPDSKYDFPVKETGEINGKV